MSYEDIYSPCILSSDIASKLIRATIGIHGTADVITKCFPHAVFFQIFSHYRKLNVVDFAHTAFGAACPVPVYSDDEGTLAQDVSLIKHGQFDNCMTNKKTAAALSLPLTGNARRPIHKTTPEIHIRNLAVIPGKDKLPDMIASIKDGFYLKEGSDSEGLIEGDYACRISLGYRIKDGELREEIRNAAAWGMSLDFLRSISMISDDFKWYPDDYIEWNGVNAAVGAPSIMADVSIGPDPTLTEGFN